MTDQQYQNYLNRRHTLISFYSKISGSSSANAFVKLCDNAFYREYSNLDREFAKRYLDKTSELPVPAGCSGVISPDGNIHGRNLDWYYNDDITVISRTPSEIIDGKTRHASIGVCITKIKEQNISDENNDLVKIIPFRIDDGINDAGLTIQVNVTPFKEITKPDNYDERTVPDLMAVRIILDDFTTAIDAAEFIRDNVYMTRKSFCYHWLISDAFGQTYLVEDYQIKNLTEEARPYMTNFRTFNNPISGSCVDWNVIQRYDRYGMGVERYAVILDSYDENLNSLTGMADLMSSKLKYTNAYRDPKKTQPYEKQWYTESCGSYIINNDILINYDISAAMTNPRLSSYSPSLSVYGDIGIADAVYDVTRNLYLQRDELSGSWWTTWTSIYDRKNKALHVKFHENSQWLEFKL